MVVLGGGLFLMSEVPLQRKAIKSYQSKRLLIQPEISSKNSGISVLINQCIAEGNQIIPKQTTADPAREFIKNHGICVLIDECVAEGNQIIPKQTSADPARELIKKSWY